MIEPDFVKAARDIRLLAIWYNENLLFTALMRNRFLRGIFTASCLALAAHAYAASEDAFDLLRDGLLSYFTPLKGSAAEGAEGKIVVDLGTETGVKEGMRFRVLREGEPFVHPITKEIIGRTETKVGTAEVQAVGPEGTFLKIISGEAREGDTLRLSSSVVRALFHQSADVPWNISERYHQKLQETGRFQLLDTAPGSLADDGEILAEAKKCDAEIAITLSFREAPTGPVLAQRVLWVEDPGELLSLEAVLEPESVAHLRAGEEYFAPREDMPVLSFKLPFNARLLSIGDPDGDGEPELLLSTGAKVIAYNAGASLRPALGGAEIKGQLSEEHIWLEAADLDGNGRDEIILTSHGAEGVISRIYGYTKGSFELLWESPIFLRTVEGRLYGQEAGSRGGYRGVVFPVDWGGAAQPGGKALTLPEGVNIYSFAYTAASGGDRHLVAYDERGHLNLYGPSGRLLWRSEETYGGVARAFEKESPAEYMQKGEWWVNDRIISEVGALFALKRFPRGTNIKGLGHNESRLMALRLTEGALEEAVLRDGLPGNTYDYEISGGKLYVLSASFSINPVNLLKGRGLFGSKLYVFSTKGYR